MILNLTKTSTDKKRIAFEEFKSLGFYISDHPLNEFSNILENFNVTNFDQFIKNDSQEAMVAGTVMSIQEKKSIKGTPFAIIKFSDNNGEFELFLFSDLLISNREKLKEAESFILTLFKDTNTNETGNVRVNIKKIVLLNEMINKSYKMVSIELKDDYNLDELSSYLKEKGNTNIKIIVPEKNKQMIFNLTNPRKFDIKILNSVKSKKYVKKITF